MIKEFSDLTSGVPVLTDELLISRNNIPYRIVIGSTSLTLFSVLDCEVNDMFVVEEVLGIKHCVNKSQSQIKTLLGITTLEGNYALSISGQYGFYNIFNPLSL
jgi:hypothetical protein